MGRTKSTIDFFLRLALMSFFSFSLAGAIPALAQTARPQDPPPLRVVASFSILGDLVTRIGGQYVAVTTLVQPGGDAHVYQPTPADSVALAKARLIVVNGLGLEGWIDRLIKASGTTAAIVTASQGITPQIMIEDDRQIADPHAWQNVANGRLYVRTITAALAKADPAHAEQYLARAQSFDDELAALDQWIRQEIAQVPPQKRQIITSHDAFGYFGKAYGVTFQAPVGISTESEPTAAGLAQLATQIKQQHVRALFIENMTDPRLVQALAQETGAVVGGEVYSDSLSPADGPADTYIGMFRHNVAAFVVAMQKNG